MEPLPSLSSIYSPPNILNIVLGSENFGLTTTFNPYSSFISSSPTMIDSGVGSIRLFGDSTIAIVVFMCVVTLFEVSVILNHTIGIYSASTPL